MSQRTRIFLVIIGLLLLALSITALVYAFTPTQVIRDVTPVAPTLLTLPPGGVP